MRCLPAAVFCCLLLFLAAPSRSDVSASGTLPVTVRDRNGMPLVGVWLTLHPLGRIVMTDGKGAAAFAGLPPGPYTVSLAPTGYHPLTLPIALAADATSSLTCVLEKNGTSTVTTQGAAGEHFVVTVPPVPRPVNPPLEYLLTPPVPPGSGPAWRMAQEDALRETTFRYLFKSPFNAAQHYQVVYLSLAYFPQGQGAEGMKNPTAAFLKRFDGNVPRVLPVSALPASSKNWDNQAKHHWIIYRVSSFKWADDSHVEISCGSAMSGFISTDSFYLNCTLKNGWWTITGATEVSA